MEAERVFLQEGKIVRKLRLIDGKLIEVEASKGEFDDSLLGLYFDVHSKQWFYKEEILKNQENNNNKETKEKGEKKVIVTCIKCNCQKTLTKTRFGLKYICPQCGE